MLDKKPVRMCINCRTRIQQESLLRFQYLDAKPVKFTKRGRSLYICHKCLTEKSLQKKFSQIFKISNEKANELSVNLKELFS